MDKCIVITQPSRTGLKVCHGLCVGGMEKCLENQGTPVVRTTFEMVNGKWEKVSDNETECYVKKEGRMI